MAACPTVTASKSLYQFQTAIVTIVLIIGIAAGIWLLELHKPYMSLLQGDAGSVPPTQFALMGAGFILAIVLAWVIGDMIDTSRTCSGSKQPKAAQVAIPIVVTVLLVAVPAIWVYAARK